MTESLYRGGYQEVSARGLVYSSKLELTWHRTFERWDWSVQYVGDSLTYADFRLYPEQGEPLFCEIKPDGPTPWERCPFVQQACQRLWSARIEAALIVRGSPPYTQWIAFRVDLQKQQAACWRASWKVLKDHSCERLVEWVRSCSPHCP